MNNTKEKELDLINKQLNGEFIKFLSDNATLVKGGIYGEVILQLYEF